MLIRLIVDKVRVVVRLWSCGAVMGGHHGARLIGAVMGLMSSPVSPTLYVISVDHEGDQFESWKFYFICKRCC